MPTPEDQPPTIEPAADARRRFGLLHVLLGVEGLVALAAVVGCFGTLSSVFQHPLVNQTASAATMILLIVAGMAMLITVVWSIRALGPKNGSATMGIAHNVLGTLGMLPVFLLLLGGAVTSDTPLFVGGVPDGGIILFFGVMVFSLPGLGVYLCRRPKPWAVFVGGLLGDLVLLVGAACFVFMWFCAAARFVA